MVLLVRARYPFLRTSKVGPDTSDADGDEQVPIAHEQLIVMKA